MYLQNVKCEPDITISTREFSWYCGYTALIFLYKKLKY